MHRLQPIRLVHNKSSRDWVLFRKCRIERSRTYTTFYITPWVNKLKQFVSVKIFAKYIYDTHRETSFLSNVGLWNASDI